VYVQDREDEYRVRVSDLKIENILGLRGLKFAQFEPNWNWTGMSPEGSIIATRDAGTDELYALDWDAR